MVAEGSPGEIKKSVSGRLLEIETPSAQKTLAELRRRYGPSKVSLFGDRVHVVVDSESDAERLKKELAGLNIEIRRAEFTEFTLEDVFISLIEERRHQIPQ
jgi:ABC-2 type transport system ATP-binding protein